MAVDGQEPADLKTMLQTEIDNIAAPLPATAPRSSTPWAPSPRPWAWSAPSSAWCMLQNMNDPAAIGPAMAVALLTTFYGAVLGNVLFIPMAGKLKTRSKTEILQKTVITEGMESILRARTRASWNRSCTPTSPRAAQAGVGVQQIEEEMPREPECPPRGLPKWMATYSDLVTLLLTFSYSC